MRNLRVILQHSSETPLPYADSSVFSVGENGYLFQAVRDRPKPLATGDSTSGLNKILASSTDQLVNGGLQDVFQIQFVSITGCLYLGTRKGQFLRYYVHVGEVEEVFHSVSGIMTFALSPDGCFVAMITCSGNLMVLSLATLDVICEHELFVPSTLEVESVPSATIRWRHDSQYFVVNVPNERNGRRLLVYDEHGSLFASVDDSISIVNDVLGWIPSGGLITAMEKSPEGKGVVISLFELKMLKRASFNPNENTLPVNTSDIKSLSWNLSSELLALVRTDTVELWHRSNYFWMLKYTICRKRPEGLLKSGDRENIKFVDWDRENVQRLHVVYECGHYSIYDCILAYTSGNTAGSALCVSTNGFQVYCTPFAFTSAPPPYGYLQVSLESKVQEVVIASFWDGFLCILLNSKLVPVMYSQTELIPLPAVIIPSVGNDSSLSYNWVWPNCQTVCCINANAIYVYELSEAFLSIDSTSQPTITMKRIIPTNCLFIRVPSHSNCQKSNKLLVFKKDDLCLVDLEDTADAGTMLFKISAGYFQDYKHIVPGCLQKQGCKTIIIIAHDILARRLEIFSVNNNYKLALDCTSTAIFDDYLLYTSVQGTLFIIHVSQLTKAIGTSDGTARLEQYSRKIEKGSVILSCCWNRLMEPTVVFQVLPRGNIETIHPRPLVIASIKMLLQDNAKRSYNTIMGAMRRHRIDANVLVDELQISISDANSTLTLRNAIHGLVNEVQDPNLLVICVTEISPDNLDFVRVLKSVLEEMIGEHPTNKKLIQPYLATMARLGLYEEILNSRLILGEPDREVVKKRIQFLSFYIDKLDTLYDAALGTYDLSLTAIVADCLNKDPKEYLPILNNLRNLPDLKRRFSINSTLKKWSKGLQDLLDDTSVIPEEISRYVHRHHLHSDALRTLSTKSFDRSIENITEIRREIQNIYGNHLEAQGIHAEASILYQRGGNLGKAVESAVKAGNWEYALTIDEHEENYGKLCHKLLQSFEEKQEWSSAARLSEVYLNDYPAAVKFWTSAHQWDHAYALAGKVPNLKQLRSDLIKPKLIDYHVTLMDSLSTLIQDFKRYGTRYAIVKAKKEAALKQDGTVDNFSDTESISTTSSMRSSTSSSQKSYRSGKNRRREQRKLYCLKEGSRHEDKAIVVRVWDTISALQLETKSDVAKTVQYLWTFELDTEAVSLTTLLDDLVAEVNTIVMQLWVIPPQDEEKMLDPKYLITPPVWTSSWDKLAF